MNITFITGNKHKAQKVSEYLGFPVAHQKVELDEIQSLDLREIVAHKVKQAYDLVGSPVLVEDVSLEFGSLGGLPGPFIKYFVDSLSFQKICDMISDDDRSAVARCLFGYYDGERIEFFEGIMPGSIPLSPAGENGFGRDPIFIPDGFSGGTRAQMNDEEYEISYAKSKAFGPLKEFLEGL